MLAAEVCATVSVGGDLSWSVGMTYRHCAATVDEYEKGEDVEVLRTKYQEALRDKNLDRIIIWAGAGIGLMKDIKPAKVCVLLFARRATVD